MQGETDQLLLSAALYSQLFLLTIIALIPKAMFYWAVGGCVFTEVSLALGERRN